MKRPVAILLGATLGAALAGCSTRASTPADGGPFLPETIGALSLGDPEAFPPEVREAVRAAALDLTQRGLHPEYHYAQFAIRGQNDIELDVWPPSAFSLKGRRRGSGGGGISFHFDPLTHRMVQALVLLLNGVLLRERARGIALADPALGGDPAWRGRPLILPLAVAAASVERLILARRRWPMGRPLTVAHVVVLVVALGSVAAALVPAPVVFPR